MCPQCFGKLWWVPSSRWWSTSLRLPTHHSRDSFRFLFIDIIILIYYLLLFYFYLLIVVILCWYFETLSRVAQTETSTDSRAKDDLELLIFLPPPPSAGVRGVSHAVHAELGIKPWQSLPMSQPGYLEWGTRIEEMADERNRDRDTR